MGRGIFEGWHLIILAVVIIALFGAKRLPDAARSIGRSMRVFRSEVDEMKKEHKAGSSDAAGTTVRGESVPPTTATPGGSAAPQDGNAVHEHAPRTDNQSGPVA